LINSIPCGWTFPQKLQTREILRSWNGCMPEVWWLANVESHLHIWRNPGFGHNQQKNALLVDTQPRFKFPIATQALKLNLPPPTPSSGSETPIQKCVFTKSIPNQHR
jgi:hypothetical protein